MGEGKLAISAFARSMEAIPRPGRERGWDALNVLIEMRKAHKAGTYAGLNVFTGKIEDMGRNNILESAC